jgi:hypothetical protein
MRIIDSHNHVYYHQLDPAGVVAELDEFGIERCWVLTWYLPPAEDVSASHGNFNPRNFRADGTHGGSTLDDVIEACRLEGSAAQRLQAAHEFYGVSICGEWSYRMLLDDPQALELFHKAGELKMPVVHLDVPFLPTVDGGRSYQTNWYVGVQNTGANVTRMCRYRVCRSRTGILAFPQWRRSNGDCHLPAGSDHAGRGGRTSA